MSELNEELNKDYLEELISRVLEKHEVVLIEEIDQISSCILPLVKKIMEYIDVEPVIKEEEEEECAFIFDHVEVFDPNELLEPVDQVDQVDSVEEKEKEEIEEIVIEPPISRFTKWFKEVWDKVTK